VARFGIKYRNSGLSDALDRTIQILQQGEEESRRRQDDERIQELLFRNDTSLLPITGTQKLEADGVSTTQPVYNTQPQTERRAKTLRDISPEAITEMLLMRSGQGEKALRATQIAEQLRQPQISSDRYRNVSGDQSVVDLLTGRTVARNPKPRGGEKTSFNINEYPVNVQQAYKVANDLNADESDRRLAAKFFEEETGQAVQVARRRPDASSGGGIGSRVRSVNGGLYYLTGALGQDGNPEIRELIPPGLSPAAASTVLSKMLDEGVIDEDTFSQAITEIATKANIPGINKSTGARGPGGAGKTTPESWGQAMKLLKEKGYTDESAKQFLEGKGYKAP